MARQLLLPHKIFERTSKRLYMMPHILPVLWPPLENDDDDHQNAPWACCGHRLVHANLWNDFGGRAMSLIVNFVLIDQIVVLDQLELLHFHPNHPNEESAQDSQFGYFFPASVAC